MSGVYDEIDFIADTNMNNTKPANAAAANLPRSSPGAPRVSIVEIAARSGVSPATVSRALNNPGLVQPRTRDAILEMCAALGYRPNASARTLRTQRSQALGIVLPTLDNPVFAECLQGMATATSAQGYSIMPVTTQYEQHAETEAIEQLVASGVDGLILVVSDTASSVALSRLRTHGTPYVLVYNRDDAHPCVSVAGHSAMQEIVEGLLERGHRDIAMVYGRLSASDRAQQRYAGFTEAMARAGITPAALIEVPFVETAIQDITLALQRRRRPTALVCSNDLIAIRAIRAAHECGFSVPDDLTVTGFDGIALVQDLAPRLSTVAQPNAQMGAAAARWLIESLARSTAPHANDSLTLPHQVRWAESSARAPDSR